jgi:predicted HicB family RNase H-like nuclease
MTILKYKDYQGEVGYEDGVLVIRLLHLDDFVTAECDKASDVQRTFEELVDDYLETCRQVGKEPHKPFRGTFNVRVSPALHRQIAMLASEEGITLNAWVARAIDERREAQQARREALDPHFA